MDDTIVQLLRTVDTPTLSNAIETLEVREKALMDFVRGPELKVESLRGRSPSNA